MAEEAVAMEISESSEDEMGRLDIDLDRKSRKLNLTSSNVLAILHEVITHEHVVAMMKTAIRDTQDLPMFEPKMTRSRLKQAMQQAHSWSLSGEQTSIRAPQFVDIELEDDEDSSDEEYCPEEEEEDDTAEETFLSDADSLVSPPRILCSQPRLQAHHIADKPSQKEESQPPAEPSFLERLNAVEEELDNSLSYSYHQSAEQKAGHEVNDGCLAFRTRSKLPLVNVPLGQLEAELLAPDITADMYDHSPPHQEEDRHWTQWLQGLMALDNEEDPDDDDDPEYNFLDDKDEPDLEDYRTDRGVQITKKEANELLEELFDALQEEEKVEVEARGQSEEEALSQSGPKFNVPQALRFEAALASMLTEQRLTIRRQYEALQQRRALQDTTNHHRHAVAPQPLLGPPAVAPAPVRMHPPLHLDSSQKLQLQQQVQQHVQLLTQVYLLSHRIGALKQEAQISKHYLEELQQFARRQEEVFLLSSFRVCNLQGALELLQEVEHKQGPPAPAAAPSAAGVSRRLLPAMTPTTNSHAFPLLPPDTAWLLATRPTFMYLELLPVCSLDPALHTRHQRNVYTAGEDGLIVLGLKHFEGAVQPDQLMSSYLLCKTRWNIRKHIREMSSSRAPSNNVIKTFLTHTTVPALPVVCKRVQQEDMRPPVDREPSNMPSWLKNSQHIIQKTGLDSPPPRYPASLPHGCSLRLHPSWISKASRPPAPHHRRFFTLAHNASLLPLCPAERQADGRTEQPAAGAPPRPRPPGVAGPGLAPPPAGKAVPSAAVRPVLLPPPTPANADATNPTVPCSAALKPGGYIVLQMVWTPKVPPAAQPAREQQPNGLTSEYVRPPADQERQGGESDVSSPMQRPARSGGGESDVSSLMQRPARSSGGEGVGQGGGEAEGQGGRNNVGVTCLNGGENGGADEGRREEGRGGGEEGGEGGEGGGGGGGEEREQGREEEQEEGGQGEDGEQERDRDKDKDEDHDRRGEEEEEDFDDLTQDEDEEEVMSSASEESVLSVPELQETMKQLTWLASERRLGADGDSEEDHSPTSAGSQEEEEEEDEEEEAPKGEESEERRSSKVEGDEETPSQEDMPRGGTRCPARGRGRSRPLRGLRRRGQERHSKDASKLLLLYDEHILDNDPHRESKDVAFARSYLNRVREALHDVPEKVEEFLSLLNGFEQLGGGREVLAMFRKLRYILGNRTDLLRDFAAFLHPEQALECGLLEEQQAFEHSRRFLRQLEISFGDNPSHYQKIIKALQAGPDLSPSSIHELKAQMAALLKGHNHLQAEFWVFFDELRPPPARPGQFEEAHWPEDAGGGGSDGGDGVGSVVGGGAGHGFEEVTLPDLEEEEEGHKIQAITGRRRRRKIDSHRNFEESDWPNKEWRCLCKDAKIRRHRRKGCSRCHGNKVRPGAVARVMKSLDPLYAQTSSALPGPADKDLEVKGDDTSPPRDGSVASWEGSFPLVDEKEEEDEADDDDDDGDGEDDEDEEEDEEKNGSQLLKKSRKDEAPASLSVPAEPPVCAKNISMTASGEKVILWTREADRVILTTCQQEGANQNTFQAISSLLGNKTPSEVSRRFRDLMRLFRSAARQASSEDETPPTEPASNQEQE